MVLEDITTILYNLTQTQMFVIGLSVIFILFHLYKSSIVLQNQNVVVNSKTVVSSNNYQTQWITKGFGNGYGDMSPAKSLPDLIQEFGPPSSFDGQVGGGATWYKKDLENTPFERIEIRDEQIPHDKPIKHTDFLYAWYKVDMPEYLIGGVHKISSSLTYDPLKKIVQARCHDMRPIVVSHWIVNKYAHEELTIDEAVGMYGPMIMELFEDDPDGNKYRQLMSELYN